MYTMTAGAASLKRSLDSIIVALRRRWNNGVSTLESTLSSSPLLDSVEGESGTVPSDWGWRSGWYTPSFWDAAMKKLSLIFGRCSVIRLSPKDVCGFVYSCVGLLEGGEWRLQDNLQIVLCNPRHFSSTSLLFFWIPLFISNWIKTVF